MGFRAQGREDRRGMAVMFEYIFGSREYAIYVKVLGIPFPMGLYNRIVPDWLKVRLIRRDLARKRSE